MKARQTRQLEAVSEALQEGANHPTAAEIHARIRRKLPRVSLGTVYRNLEKLIAASRAIPVRLGHEATRYDGMVTPHDHFVCERCAAITDLTTGMEPDIDTQQLRRAGYFVRSHSLAVFGLCQACAVGSTPRRRLGAQRGATNRSAGNGNRRKRSR